jgi:hypothetical protein
MRPTPLLAPAGSPFDLVEIVAVAVGVVVALRLVGTVVRRAK